MKKIETKKENSGVEEVGTKKIGDLYGKKLSAIKKGTAKNGVSVRKTKPLMSDMLPAKEPAVAEEASDQDKEALWESGKAIAAEMAAEPAASTMDDVTYGDMLSREASTQALAASQVEEAVAPMATIPAIQRSSDNETVAEDTAEPEEEAAIVAMREEIRRKMKEKSAAEQAEALTEEMVLTEKTDKKAFGGMFSFGKKEPAISAEENMNNVEKIASAKKEDVLAGLSEQDKKVIEKKATKDNLVVAFLMFVIMFTLGVTAFYFYVQYRQPGIVPNVALSSVAQAKKDVEEAKKIVSEDGFVLPDDEEPVLATVTDVLKMKKQSFYADARNGDRVLIYAMNKKAILFRPSTSKIIKVNEDTSLNQVAVNAPAENAPDDKQTGAEASVRVAVYNGTNTKGLAQKISDAATLISGVAVTEKSNAIGEYAKTVVIDLSGEQEDLVQRLAEALQAEVVSFPAEEKKPDAAILIIGGSDFQAAE